MLGYFFNDSKKYFLLKSKLIFNDSSKILQIKSELSYLEKQ